MPLAEAAETLGIPATTIKSQLQKGQAVGHKEGGKWLVDVSSVRLPGSKVSKTTALGAKEKRIQKLERDNQRLREMMLTMFEYKMFPRSYRNRTGYEETLSHDQELVVQYIIKIIYKEVKSNPYHRLIFYPPEVLKDTEWFYIFDELADWKALASHNPETSFRHRIVYFNRADRLFRIATDRIRHNIRTGDGGSWKYVRSNELKMWQQVWGGLSRSRHASS
jgi:hypothetical protein